MKINLSRFFRYGLVVALNILCIFTLQYFINSQNNVSKLLSDLKVSVFINQSTSDEINDENVIDKIQNSDKLTNLEFINSSDFDKFSNIEPSLEEFIPKEVLNLPSIILANVVNINDFVELEKVKEEILSFDFVNDFVYDEKAFNLFFNYKETLNKYKKIFSIIFYVIIFLFVLKILFFLIKSLYRDILLEISFGILLGTASYAIICFITVFNESSVFLLDWHILYFILPLSSMICLLTKESNV